ncbi:hypothetical protein E3P99_00961 [Wallemia hederae]|uniref:DUF6534 domain-containing protein n=1 Tax=Wallemia hederae TaxID=1540922 RepID=A0A4T0FS53_9BASI|nr:hypothetical protein E3P99_00961 [Wallemia hederae]
MVYQPTYDNPALEALGSNIPANLGSYLIGCVLNLVLMAILGMQGLDYYSEWNHAFSHPPLTLFFQNCELDPPHTPPYTHILDTASRTSGSAYRNTRYMLTPTSSTVNKSIVGFLLVAGLFQAGCFVEMLWRPFIDGESAQVFARDCSLYAAGFGDLTVWNNTTWTWWSEPIVSSIIAVVCQAFFLNRCWRVTRSYIVVVVALIGMTAALAFGVACTYFLSKFVLFTESNRIQSKICASSWLAFSTATDIWISTFLVVHLMRERKRLSFNTTERVFASILNFTLKTAALTSVWVTVNLALYASNNPTTGFAWSVFQFNFGRVYSISVLYTLLSRIDVRKILSVHNVQVSSSRGRSGEAGHAQSAIHIRTEVERDYELDDKMSTSVSPTPPALDRTDSGDTELGLRKGAQGLQDSIIDDDRSTRALRLNTNAPF